MIITVAVFTTAIVLIFITCCGGARDDSARKRVQEKRDKELYH